MNFLAHYHYFNNGNPNHDTGLVLPDLVKAFCKSPLRISDKGTTPGFIQLAEGTIKHINADALFHNSSFFKNASGFISEQLDYNSLWPRKWFMNHLLTEILCDRILMEEDPELCQNFYQALDGVNRDQVGLFLKMNGVPNYQNFAPGFDRFVSLRFINEYLYNEKLIIALSRVYSRVGIRYEWTDQDRELLLERIPACIEYLKMHMSDLEKLLKE